VIHLDRERITQTTLDGEIIRDDVPLSIYWRLVIDDNIQTDKIEPIGRKNRVRDLITTLLQEGTTLTFDEIMMNENPKRWILELLHEFKFTNVRNLLSDFSNDMRTRQRTENKHAVLFYTTNLLFICHSNIGERTTTEQEAPNGTREIDVVRRFVDKDNMDRFVAFEMVNNQIIVHYFEYSRSGFFHRWLGIPEAEIQYRYSENRFFCNIYNIRCILELTDDEILNRIINSNDITYNRNSIQIHNILFEIEKIISGRNRYTNVIDFMDDFKLRMNSLDRYQKEYQKILLESAHIQFIDKRNEVIKISESGSREIYLRKENEEFNIVFVNERVKISTDYLDYLIWCFLNGERQEKIFYAGMQFTDECFSIGKLEFYNKFILSENQKLIIEKFREIIPGIINRNMTAILSSILFELLNQFFKPNHQISSLFDEISKRLASLIEDSTIIDLEKPEIEYKARDWFVGNDPTIINRIKEDIVKKIEISNFVCYIIGIDENEHKLDTIPNSRIKSERLNLINDGLKNELSERNIKIHKFIPISIKGETLLVLICYKSL